MSDRFWLLILDVIIAINAFTETVELLICSGRKPETQSTGSFKTASSKAFDPTSGTLSVLKQPRSPKKHGDESFDTAPSPGKSSKRKQSAFQSVGDFNSAVSSLKDLLSAHRLNTEFNKRSPNTAMKNVAVEVEDYNPFNDYTIDTLGENPAIEADGNPFLGAGNDLVTCYPEKKPKSKANTKRLPSAMDSNPFLDCEEVILPPNGLSPHGIPDESKPLVSVQLEIASNPFINDGDLIIDGMNPFEEGLNSVTKKGPPEKVKKSSLRRQRSRNPFDESDPKGDCAGSAQTNIDRIHPIASTNPFDAKQSNQSVAWNS